MDYRRAGMSHEPGAASDGGSVIAERASSQPTVWRLERAI
jgi:hypothetical protein